MYKSIVVAIDINHADRGKDIIKKGKSLLDSGGDLHLIYVMPSIPTYAQTYLPADILAQNQQDASAKLHALARADNVQANIEVRDGHPSDEVLNFAEEAKADLIVVASHHPGLTDYLIGSTAGRVVRHAQCSVLVDR